MAIDNDILLWKKISSKALEQCELESIDSSMREECETIYNCASQIVHYMEKVRAYFASMCGCSECNPTMH